MKVSQASAYALHALMYMVRHVTQLPVTSATIAKADGMPADYLAKVMQQLTKVGFVRSVRGRSRGYVFSKDPATINLLMLFEAIEGQPLFDDCPLKHCACGGTKDNCRIFSQWVRATRELKELLGQTSVASAAWSHPEHRFNVLPDFTEDEEVKSA